MKRIFCYFLALAFVISGFGIVFAESKTLMIQVFTSPKTLYVDGNVVKGLQDFKYEIKKGTHVAYGSDDDLMLMYNGNKIECTAILDGLSQVLDEHLKNGTSFKIEYFEAEKEGGKVKKTTILNCRVSKLYFSYDKDGKTFAKYIINGSEVRGE